MRLSIVFALILLLSMITGCAEKAKYSIQSYDDFPYIEGSLIYINESSSNPLLGRLDYCGTGIYFLRIQHKNYYRGLRKSSNFLNGKKLNAYISDNSLLSEAFTGGRLDIRLNQEQVESVANGDFQLKNIDYTGRTIEIEIPENYANQFMDKVCQLDPTQERESLQIQLVKR